MFEGNNDDLSSQNNNEAKCPQRNHKYSTKRCSAAVEQLRQFMAVGTVVHDEKQCAPGVCASEGSGALKHVGSDQFRTRARWCGWETEPANSPPSTETNTIRTFFDSSNANGVVSTERRWGMDLPFTYTRTGTRSQFVCGSCCLRKCNSNVCLNANQICGGLCLGDSLRLPILQIPINMRCGGTAGLYVWAPSCRSSG